MGQILSCIDMEDDRQRDSVTLLKHVSERTRQMTYQLDRVQRKLETMDDQIGHILHEMHPLSSQTSFSSAGYVQPSRTGNEHLQTARYNSSVAGAVALTQEPLNELNVPSASKE